MFYSKIIYISAILIKESIYQTPNLMKKITLLVALLLTTIITVNAQTSEKQKAEKYLSTQGELTFTFQVNNSKDIEMYSKDFSIINYIPQSKTEYIFSIFTFSLSTDTSTTVAT